MAKTKDSYGIPYGLEQSFIDMPISLQSKDGSVGRVVPLVVVLGYVFSSLACLFCVTKTFIGRFASVPQLVLFVILWALLTVVLTKYDGTRRMNLQRIPTLLAYLPKSARRITTRTSSNAGPFWALLGIESIASNGLISFQDGTFGYCFRVVGSASILLFEDDRDAILQRVDSFYRKWDRDTELLFLTMKESQKVDNQMQKLHQRYMNLRNDDKDLRDLAEENFSILKEYVGREYRSIHQYMVLKSANSESLRTALNILKSEVDNSSLMLKQCVMLELDDDYQVLQSIFRKGGE